MMIWVGHRPFLTHSNIVKCAYEVHEKGFLGQACKCQWPSASIYIMNLGAKSSPPKTQGSNLAWFHRTGGLQPGLALQPGWRMHQMDAEKKWWPLQSTSNTFQSAALVNVCGYIGGGLNLEWFHLTKVLTPRLSEEGSTPAKGRMCHNSVL